MVGNALFTKGAYEKAVEAYSNALKKDPHNAFLLYFQGNALVKCKKITAAIKSYEKAIMDKFRGKLKYGNYNAPAAIAVLANLKIARNNSSIRYWVQDCSAATENILIAAVGLGLGAVWCGVHPIFIFEGRMRAVLGIPKNVTPLGVIQIGYPAEKKEPGTKYQESRVHWQKY